MRAPHTAGNIRPEMLHVAAVLAGKILVGGERFDRIPWMTFAGHHIYAMRKQDIDALLIDAASRGYQILEGFVSERRGLRAFTVAIGAWASSGRVECRALDSWALYADDAVYREDRDRETVIESEITRLEAALRAVCMRLESEKVKFNPSAHRWLNALYRYYCLPLEPYDHSIPLSKSVLCLARMAHIGGPIVHVRSSLEPYVTVDRHRAFGEALRQELPSGAAIPVDIKGKGLHRWGPHDLMRSCGIASATVRVETESRVPLLPISKPDPQPMRNIVIHPIGTFRGTWCLHELAHLESSGHGYVEAIHKAVVFDSRPIYRPLIDKLRSIEKDLAPVLVKRLEHVVYGRCAKSPILSRIASTPSWHAPRIADMLDDRAALRIGKDFVIDRFRIGKSETPIRGPFAHELSHIVARIEGRPEAGGSERPDRSAWVTATNRIAVWDLVDHVSRHLGSARIGDHVGRIYVDGVDFEATPEQINLPEGCELRDHGRMMHVLRAGVIVAESSKGVTRIEAAGIPTDDTDLDSLRMVLKLAPQSFVERSYEGRSWPEGEDDPRLAPGAVSSPIEMTLERQAEMGFPLVGASP